MLGLVLLYVGAVLFCNGIWLLGLIQDREIAIINIFVGIVGLIVVVIELATSSGTLTTSKLAVIQGGAFTLLFVFTYLWIAYNRFFRIDGSGLGWYSLFVCLTAIPTAVITLRHAHGVTAQVWLGADWIAWAVLWGLYFLLLARPIQWTGITKITGALTVAEGIGTGWILGYLLLNANLHL